VGLAVVIVVVQPRELPAFGDDDLAIDDLEPERLVEPGREALPRDGAAGLLRRPDVAMSGANGDAAVRQEVPARDEEESVPGVLVGEREGVDNERTPGVLARFELGGDGFGPVWLRPDEDGENLV